jgi:hypothetical protein
VNGVLGRRFAGWIGDEQRVIEEVRAIDIPATEREREQDAIELSAVERVARRAAGLLAKVKLEVRPMIAKPGQHSWQEEGRDGRDDAHPKLAMQRPSLSAGSLGEFLGFAENLHRFVGNFFAEEGEAHDPPSPLDKHHAQQTLQFAQARGKGGLSNEASIGGLAEMAEAPERHEILKLFDGRQMDDH